MINSVSDCHSTGDAIEFVESNIESLIKLEELVKKVSPDPYENPYSQACILLEQMEMWIP